MVGTAVAHETLFDLVILSARQPDMASLFNAASAAWNNAFFFTGLVSLQPTHPLTVTAPSIPRRSRTHNTRFPPRQNRQGLWLPPKPTLSNLPHSPSNARFRLGMASRRSLLRT